MSQYWGLTVAGRIGACRKVQMKSGGVFEVCKSLVDSREQHLLRGRVGSGRSLETNLGP